MSIRKLFARIFMLSVGLFLTKISVEAIIAEQLSSRGYTWSYEEEPIQFCVSVLVRFVPGLVLIYYGFSKEKSVKKSNDEQDSKE